MSADPKVTPWSARHPCPVCGGHPSLPSGKGIRCYGFLSSDGWLHCTRDEHAGVIALTTGSQTYAHKPAGPCTCGVEHAPGKAAPILRMPPPKDGTRRVVRERSWTIPHPGGDFIHHRKDYSDGGKSMWWERNGQTNLDGFPPSDIPLYGLDTLDQYDSAGVIVLTEGEQACDALRARGIAAVATVCGATVTPADVVLAPLALCHLALWPDNDVPGARHMDAIAAALTRLAGSSPHIVRWPEAPPKGDAADLNGQPDDVVQALIDVASPWEPPPDAAAGFPLPVDMGDAVKSELGDVHYTEDLHRPGRILVVAAEEGTGKSFAISGELGIRLAGVGGTFAGTWPIVQTGGVLVLSEMHLDDDIDRTEAIAEALEWSRADLKGKYHRLDLMTAADGKPCLRDEAWRSWCVDWCRANSVRTLIVDTATGASDVDPWGREIQEVYRGLRAMLTAYPDLAIILIVHCKKPQGHGERRLSDVLGEWARWCDVVLMMEKDGHSRAKLTTYKRVRKPRRVIVSQQDGLLVDAVDITDGGQSRKVSDKKVLEAVAASPGITIKDLAVKLGVVKKTAERYVNEALANNHIRAEIGAKRQQLLFATATPRQTASDSGVAVGDAVDGDDRDTATASIYKDAVGVAVALRGVDDAEEPWL